MEYTDGLDQAECQGRAMTDDATLRDLELIGEAVNRMAQTVRDAAAQIPRRQIVTTGNRPTQGKRADRAGWTLGLPCALKSPAQ